MGSGKTIFTKGLAKAMGISSLITSPTYNLVNHYQTSDRINKLTHIDVWRITNSKEILDLNISKEITDKSVLAIEWAEKLEEYIRNYNEEAIIVWVKIENTADAYENERIISWGNY